MYGILLTSPDERVVIRITPSIAVNDRVVINVTVDGKSVLSTLISHQALIFVMAGYNAKG